jgi:hypothetical protein
LGNSWAQRLCDRVNTSVIAEIWIDYPQPWLTVETSRFRSLTPQTGGLSAQDLFTTVKLKSSLTRPGIGPSPCPVLSAYFFPVGLAFTKSAIGSECTPLANLCNVPVPRFDGMAVGWLSSIIQIVTCIETNLELAYLGFILLFPSPRPLGYRPFIKLFDVVIPRERRSL